MNRLVVEPGMSVVVPAGTVHAIGAGIFCAELQEPTDFSIMLETAGFDLDVAEGELGLGRDQAMSCIKQNALKPSELGSLQRRGASFTEAAPAPAVVGQSAGDDDAADILAPAAKPYFRARRFGRSHPGPVEPSFAVLVGTWGEGRVVGEGWEVAAHRGTTLVVPWAAGAASVEGPVELIRCLPPLPADAASDWP
jgi:mannose-6-phosphate isomerase